MNELVGTIVSLFLLLLYNSILDTTFLFWRSYESSHSCLWEVQTAFYEHEQHREIVTLIN